MQYAASFLAVKMTISNKIFGDMHVNIYFFSIYRMFHFCVTAEALPLLFKNSIDATIWSEMLQYGLTYIDTMQTWSHSIRCEPSDVSGYLIRTSGCLIWHDLTSLIITVCGLA